MRRPIKFTPSPYGFDIYLVNVKTIRRMAQFFVAFLEKLNSTLKIKIKLNRTFYKVT